MRAIVLAFVAFCMALPARAEIAIQEVTSPGGITAWLVEEPSIPFTALEIRFRGGATLDVPRKRGAVNLMVGLLEEGTGDLDARAFAKATESLAASFGYDAYNDAVAISAKFLTENRDEAVDLLRRSIVEPSFPEDALERVRQQVLSVIRSDLKDPDQIASRVFNELAFGDHPYGSPLEGTLESVTALTRDDILAAHRGALARDRLYVAAVGDITAPELAELLDTLLGGLPDEGRDMPPRVEFGLDGGITVVEFDTPQSVAQFGHVGIRRDDPDFFAAFLVNQILGAGSFETRLMTEVREKRGLTYGVYSYLVPRDLSEMLLGRVASANERIAEAIEVIGEEWRKISETGVTAEELRDAKTFLTGAYPLRFSGNGPIANILVGMQMDDLPTDYVLTRNAKLEAVTLEEANRVARRIFDPDALHFVVVGKPQGLEPASN